MKKLRHIQDLYDIAGNMQQVAADLGIHQITVERFRTRGIHVKYHDKLAKLYNLDPVELYLLSQKVRGYRGK